MLETAGLLFALVSIICWGTNFVPLKMARRPNLLQFQALMSVGIFALSVAAMLLLNFPFTLTLFGLVSGILWAVGNYLSVKAVSMSGLAKTAPIWMGMVILFSFAFGIIFFQEEVSFLLMGILGIVALLVGINVVAASGGEKVKGAIKGVIFAALAGLLFGFYLIPLKISGLQPGEFIFSMSLGILAASWAIFFIRRGPLNFTNVKAGLASGAIWNVANISSLFAISSLGLAIGFPITQLALLVAVGWGIFYFKEIRKRSSLVKIILGAVLLVIGAFLLAFSKT